MIKSPCTGKCKYTLHTDICEGCLRTKQEIINWSSYSDEKREQIMNDISWAKAASNEVYNAGLLPYREGEFDV